MVSAREHGGLANASDGHRDLAHGA
jgi:hypothetical protein